MIMPSKPEIYNRSIGLHCVSRDIRRFRKIAKEVGISFKTYKQNAWQDNILPKQIKKDFHYYFFIVFKNKEDINLLKLLDKIYDTESETYLGTSDLKTKYMTKLYNVR